MKFQVPEMSCGHCTAAIEKSILAADPAAVVATDLETRVVNVVSTASPDSIAAAIRKAGYEPAPA